MSRFVFSALFFVFVSLNWGLHAHAATYYVDYDSGSDSNDGLSVPASFKHSPTDTVATGNAASITPIAGDTVCFKGGVIYRGTPKPMTSGTDGSPVVWDGECVGFGSGKAIIDGSEILSGCTIDALVNGHQSYVCPLPSGLPTNAVPFALNLYQGEQKMVLAQATPMANYYNTDNTDEYFSIPFAQAVRTADATEVTDATNLTAYFSDYQNSYLKIWVYGNRINTLQVNSVDIPNNKIITERAAYDPLDDSGSARYTIINHRAAFDSLGEYWVDIANSLIYLIPPSSFNPNNSDITYSKRQEALDVQASYNLIKNMVVQKGAAGTGQYRHNGGIRIYNGNSASHYTGITIDNVESRYNNSIEGYAAIYAEYADNTTIRNCYVHHNAPNRGIHVTSSDYALVENNEVTAIDGTAIAFFGVNYGAITHNYVHDNASVHGNGITTYLSSNHNTVAYNRVINSQIAYTTQASADNIIAFNIFSTPADSGVTVAAWSSAGTSDLEFYNNIILNGTPGSGLYVASDSEAGLIVKNNIMDGGPNLTGSNISNNIYTSLAYNQSVGYGWSLGPGEVEATYDQLFVDAPGGNYQPKADSTSINAGVDMSASLLTEDLLGVSLADRIWDIGAYEYVSPANTASSITQYGITWTFDHAYQYGQYVNGDYWVVGPVTITSITPDATLSPGRNGWEINPVSHATQPYDDRSYNYNTSVLPSLPNTVPINSSVVKTVSTVTSGHTNIQTAAVLTVLPSVPENNGSTLFRPPYFGTSKISYSLSDMDLSGFPSLASVANTPTLASVVSNFQKVQLDHLEGWVGRTIHPVDNMPDYGSDISNNISSGILRLMLDESVQDKEQAAVMLTQAAIDWYEMRATGQVWAANGGHSMGRKLIILFGGIILNNQDMKDAVSNGVDATYQENGQIIFYQQANNGNGMQIWGQPATEIQYWRELATPDAGSKTVLDPYGYIDGGYEPGGVYQDLTAPVFKSESIAARLLPGGAAIWSDSEFFDYVERWVTVGAWTQPDPCAPFDGVFEAGNSDYLTNWDTNYGSAFGTNGDGGCIFDTNPVDGIGRLSLFHGNRGNAYYSNDFADSMYAAYANSVDVSSPILMAISSGTAGQTTATITWNTNEGATSRVEYGSTDSYGSFTTIDSNLVTSHSVALVGLTSNTTYHYRVLSSDASSNVAVSVDQTFTTAVADVVPSVVTTPTVTTSTSSSSNKSKKKKKKISSKITYKQGERTKPYITLLTPKQSSSTNKKFSIKASASDRSGIQAMFVSINGTKKKRVNNLGSILYTSKKLKNASITISAYDKLGNVKIAQITVTNGVVTGVRYY